MKKLTLLLSIIVYSLHSIAQIDIDSSIYTTQTATQAFDSIFTPVNKETLPKPGILYDRVTPIANLLDYQEGDKVSAGLLLQSLSELERSQYNFIPKETEANHKTFARIMEYGNKQSILPIIIMDKGISFIDTTAYKDGRLQLGNDSLLHNGATPGNPFLSKTIRMAGMGAYQNNVIVDQPYQLKFIIPQAVNDNGAKDIGKVIIRDLTSGQSWEIVIDGSKEIKFTGASGIKRTFRIEVFDNNGALLWVNSQDLVFIIAPGTRDFIDNSPCMSYRDNIYGNEPYQGAGESSASYGIGEYVIFHAPGNCAPNKKVTKPIIISDAWDPQDVRKAFNPNMDINTNKYNDIYHDRMKYEDENNQTRNLVDNLNAQGYDVIIVNYTKYATGYSNVNGIYIPTGEIDGGTDFIERNAQIMVAVIRDMNYKLQQSGSTAQIVVVGPSMGGQITRYALRWMEQQYALGQTQLKPNCRLWVSFDSPNHGANIPFDLQETIRYLGDVEGVEAAQTFLKQQLRAPAAREMLISQIIDYNGQPLTTLASYMDGQNPIHLNYYANLNAMGMPQSSRNVALINGKYTGSSYHTPGNKMFDFEIKKTNNGRVMLKNATYFAPNSFSTMVNFHKVNVWHYLFGGMSNVYKLSGSVNYPNGYTALDGAPGGMYDVQSELYDVIDGQSFSFSGFNLVGSVPFKTFNACFIPSYSSLAIVNKNTNWNNPINIKSLVCNNGTPFDNVYAPKSNEFHTELNAKNVDWIMQEIEKGAAGCPDICKNTLLQYNDLNTPLCIGSTRTFYHNYNLPAGATVTWEYRDVAVQLISSNNNSITIKAIADAPAYVRAIINNPCGANVVEHIIFASGSGYTFKVSDEDIYHPTYGKGKTLTVNPNSTYLTSVKWSLDGMTFTGHQTTYNVYKPASSDYKDVWIKTQNSCGETVFNKRVYFNNNEYNEYYGISGKLPNLFASEISVYPNPTTSNWTVDIPNTEVATLELYDVNGRKIWTKQNAQFKAEVPGSEIPSGMYLLKIRMGTQEKTQKLIKQ